MTFTNEERLIRLLARQVRTRGQVRIGIGDDACVLADGTVMTTDAYVEGVHFDFRYMSWRDVGAHCACAAVSDVVAMGADPAVVLVALGVPGPSRVSRVWSHTAALYRGIESVCAVMGCEVAGGDTVRSDRVMLTLTATGRAARPILRAGARTGDSVYVTGTLGDSEAGRRLLDSGRRERWAGPLIRRHLRPVPRLGVMRALRGRISALTDTSDGLATDGRHLAEAGDVRIVLSARDLPVSRGVRRFCSEEGRDTSSFVLGAGDDYELLFCSDARLPSVVRGVAVTRIGIVEAGRGLYLRAGSDVGRVTLSGYDHFSRRPD